MHNNKEMVSGQLPEVSFKLFCELVFFFFLIQGLLELLFSSAPPVYATFDLQICLSVGKAGWSRMLGFQP